MSPNKHNTIAREEKLVMESMKSDGVVKHCKSGLELFPCVNQKVLVFGHPMAHLLLKSHKTVGISWECNSLNQFVNGIVVIYTHMTRFCPMKMISKFRGKELSMLDFTQIDLFQRMIQ